MFKGGQTNPFDDIVAKTTDENLTGENWELIMNLCDKVNDEGEAGARNVVAAILRRLTHRLSNVQLYTLTLAESLSKNCGVEVHRELASRAFTQALDRLITDRNTHDKVKKRALGLIEEWVGDFEKDDSIGVMRECYESLKNRGYKFEATSEPPPPEVDDEVRRREEEELQMVLEMSVRDKGGRGAWGEYTLASSSGAGASSSAASAKPAPAPAPGAQSQAPVYGGYVPSASPAVSATTAPAPAPAPQPAAYNNVAASPAPSTKSHDSNIPIVTRVRALHTFEPTEAGELAFEKGDIIKVVDRNYKDWWRGQLKGRTGIFPVNYVESLPEPTAAELAKEAEQEAAVFSQAANVDRLLTMLRQMDPAKDSLADNEEIQELYRSCMTLRPRIVKLIDKYSQKRADLVSMNETFVKARTIFDRMMEESLARHSAAAYETRPSYAVPYPQPDSRGPSEYPPQPYAWGTPGYEQPAYGAYPTPPAGYAPGPEGYAPPAPPPHQYAEGYPQQQQQQAYPPQPYAPVGPAPVPYGAPPPQGQQYPAPQGPLGPAPQVSPHVEPAQAPPMQPQQPPLQTQQPQVQPQVQSQVQPQIQSQPQVQAQAQPAQVQAQPQPQSQSSQQAPPSGPPYVFDPNATYPDPNVQAWATYYAQGGVDPTGAVYFVSVPGVKDAEPPAPASAPGPAAGAPASPVSQHSVYTGGQGAQGAVQNASVGSLGSYQAQAGAQAGAPVSGSPTAQGPGQGGWPAQYNQLPGQFASMDVGRDERQGVGAPA